ncbi:LacI family DNA-binding transcriptional regulator [Paenibacillus hodogayensis]|uniref:LacI family DNA-binding transcriptional regulator n=1 Tax=Paenibacillus hodogayensis TaxID=279208 RepID=A0ABV5W2L1_9BACL
MRKRKSITLRDLSKQLGLSVHTVSKALRGLPGMSEDTRNEVIRRAQEAGYRTKDQERVHAMERVPLYTAGKPYRFALIIPDRSVAMEINQLIIGGLQSKLAEYGHAMETIVVPYVFPEGSSYDEWEALHPLDYMDGLFIAPMVGQLQEKRLLAKRVPRILINFPGSAAAVDSIAWDVGTAVHQSVRYLHANGHRNIMYVGRMEGHRGFVIRWQAFGQAMAEAGLSFRPEDQMVAYDNQSQWNTQFIEKLRLHQPTALLCGVKTDLAWIYHACSVVGKRIPEDISLISMHHMEEPHMPELSRPVIRIRESGIRAAERMLWRLANPHQPYEHILLQGSFFEGATVRVLPAEAP